MAVARQREAVIEVGFGLLVLVGGCFDLRVEPGEPTSDAVLLGLEEVDGDRSGVVGL
ncbi:hypothetical protein [Cumulibacter soli]|uniref:hypothetical protein n=1 Tax=Cumulibacter soli TaxID=2546344 RepID=UPI0014192DBF|nr:hypothetical protein [Cumulibacter soli]